LTRGKLPVTKSPEQIDVIAAQHGVTDAGARLLKVLADPMNRTMKMVNKCELADISQDTYYRLFGKDERFMQAYRELCQSTVLSQAIVAIHGLTAQAAMGDTQAAKLVLELAGFYQPSAKVEHTHTMEAGESLLQLYRARQKELSE